MPTFLKVILLGSLAPLVIGGGVAVIASSDSQPSMTGVASSSSAVSTERDLQAEIAAEIDESNRTLEAARLESETAERAANAADKKPGKTTKHRKRSKRKTKKHSSGDSAKNTTGDENVPDTLDKNVARRVLRGVRMLHCAGAGDVRVTVKIGSTGRVSSVSRKTHDDVGTCVAETVQSLRFPQSVQGLTTSHRYHW